ncbi:hypothetical protein [Streptomyces roseolilacinus]|uniref:Uncharacterized protein n=1 Tax=Streptomyces roseolilacinus TaxID=66904 RepID=A0A918B2J6_9ACTN|nr:hypothetical protein [Streptomyces roseolilacinus]GGQ04309.1 hypothetical protein GCM10010249_23380 [Streptomyces roseolilacinus]
MNRTTRWLLLAAGSLVVFGLCVWLGDALLPWDRPERVGAGAGAGAVLVAVLVAWGSSVINPASPPPSPPPPPSGATRITASGERSVATGDNTGIIVTGDNGTIQR